MSVHNTEFFFYEIGFAHGPGFNLEIFEDIFKNSEGLDYGYEIDTDVPTETIVKFSSSEINWIEICDKIEGLDPNMGKVEFTTELEIDDVYLGIDDVSEDQG